MNLVRPKYWDISLNKMVATMCLLPSSSSRKKRIYPNWGGLEANSFVSPGLKTAWTQVGCLSKSHNPLGRKGLTDQSINNWSTQGYSGLALLCQSEKGHPR